MKKIFTILGICAIAPQVYGQAITITAADMPTPTMGYSILDLSTTAAPSPTVGTSAAWDYSTYMGTPTLNPYTAESDTFFTHAGVDVNVEELKQFNSAVGYNYFSEIDFNASNVKETGIKILYQAYSLSAYTGSTSDSLVIPAQEYMLSSARVIVNFPFTANSAWHSQSQRVTNFTLTVAALSLSHTAAQHRYVTYRNDTIIGWGKMKVYTAAGPSLPYDVLMDKISQYSVDSFYLAGSPASATLLAGFGISQGQNSDTAYRYNFYRKGSYDYLASFYYGTDYTYTTPANKYVDTENLKPYNVGVAEVGNGTFTTVIFPNPSNGSEINLMINGNNATAEKYFITDMTGKTIQEGPTEMRQGAIHVALNNQPAAGNYLITVTDGGNNKIATEQFVIAR